MTPDARSLAEEGLAIGWFILASQLHNTWSYKAAIAMGIFCMITSIYYGLKK